MSFTDKMRKTAQEAVLNDQNTQITVIPAGTSESSVINKKGFSIAGIEMDTAWTAADLTFLVSSSIDGRFQPLQDEYGAELVVTAAAAKNIGFTSGIITALAPWPFIKIRSGKTGALVSQVAARTINLVVQN